MLNLNPQRLEQAVAARRNIHRQQRMNEYLALAF